MAEHVDDELDLEDQELHAHDHELEDLEDPDGEREPPVHDPGGVPRSLTPQGYRSVNPLVGVGAIAVVLAIVGAVLWSLLAHPRPTLAASPLVAVTPGATTAPDASMPDPTETPFGRPRTKPFFSIAQARVTPAPVAIAAETSTTATMTTSGPPPQQQISDAAPPGSEPSVPRAKTAAEMTADANGRDLAAASRASSRMQLESQDAQAQRDLGGSAAAAYGSPATGAAVTYPVQGLPGASTAATEADDTFASEPGASGRAGGSMAARPAHSGFVAARSGDPALRDRHEPLRARERHDHPGAVGNGGR